MRSARVLAQAKINVWLHVLGPRADGFHDLMTLFQRLELADEITIRTSDAQSRYIDVTGPRVPAQGFGNAMKNLAYRAAEEFHARTGWPRGFQIALTKHIPVGGGLGGGSADAGAVLRALNAMAPHPLDHDALHAVAASLGSDVPFFVTEHVAALAAGRGEALSTGFLPMPRADVLLVVPPFAIATADAYRWLRESGPYHQRPSGPYHQIPSGPSSGSLEHQSRFWAAFDRGNTFEPVVEAKHPELRDYREKLSKAGASIARLSGSGSTVFGLFESRLPDPRDLGINALMIPTRTAKNVVQVEVQE
jgi:4-diphosphocytidyl-2-C-methyl-D-erythritol kinase